MISGKKIDYSVWLIIFFMSAAFFSRKVFEAIEQTEIQNYLTKSIGFPFAENIIENLNSMVINLITWEPLWNVICAYKKILLL